MKKKKITRQFNDCTLSLWRLYVLKKNLEQSGRGGYLVEPRQDFLIDWKIGTGLYLGILSTGRGLICDSLRGESWIYSDRAGSGLE